ncbi:MAG: type II secretion system F family protein [Candidatus Obscuribacterales bacterium]|nr:type II secretion system F family protein [Candidatus Obscuribacterales bacterium]
MESAKKGSKRTPAKKGGAPAKGTPKGKGAAGVKQKKGDLLARFEKVKLKDMVVFSRQFSAMVGSGVAMLRTLTIISEQCENEKLRAIITDVKNQVEGGSNLSAAMARHPEVFDRLYISMVKAGETGGILDEVMKRVSEFLESRARLTDKVKSAMAYPVVAMFVAVVVFWAMLTFILPVFQNIFEGMGGELPEFTRFLIMLSELMRSWWMVLFVAVVVSGTYFFKQWVKTPMGRYQVDGMMLRVPVFGDVIRKVAVARFTRTFGTLIHSGVPMLSSLEVVRETAGNAVLSAGVDEIHKEVRQGGSISKPMSKNPLFPPMVVQMIAVGEETGKLDDMLEKVADFYDNEVENSVEALTSVLEPILVIGVGGIVGSVVVGMYLPIFTIINQLK